MSMLIIDTRGRCFVKTQHEPSVTAAQRHSGTESVHNQNPQPWTRKRRLPEKGKILVMKIEIRIWPQHETLVALAQLGGAAGSLTVRESSSQVGHAYDLFKCLKTGLGSHYTNFSQVLHLFGTLCLVHVSLHPTIYSVSTGISIPTFSYSEPIYFLFYYSPVPWVAFSLVRGEYAFF